MRCSFCGKSTHTITNCPSTHAGSTRRARMHCTYCGSKEHNINACPKTWGGNAARTWNPDSVSDDFVLDKK